MMTFRIYFNCKNIFEGWLKGCLETLLLYWWWKGGVSSVLLLPKQSEPALGGEGAGLSWHWNSLGSWEPIWGLEKSEWEVCWLKIVSPWLHFCLYPDSSACRKSSYLLLCVLILFIILHFPKRDKMQPHPRNGSFKMILFSGSAVSSSFAALARLQNKWRALRPRWGDEYCCSRFVKLALSVLMWSLQTQSHPILKEEQERNTGN